MRVSQVIKDAWETRSSKQLPVVTNLERPLQPRNLVKLQEVLWACQPRVGPWEVHKWAPQGQGSAQLKVPRSNHQLPGPPSFCSREDVTRWRRKRKIKS